MVKCLPVGTNLYLEVSAILIDLNLVSNELVLLAERAIYLFVEFLISASKMWRAGTNCVRSGRSKDRPLRLYSSLCIDQRNPNEVVGL